MPLTLNHFNFARIQNGIPSVLHFLVSQVLGAASSRLWPGWLSWFKSHGLPCCWTYRVPRLKPHGFSWCRTNPVSRCRSNTFSRCWSNWIPRLWSCEVPSRLAPTTPIFAAWKSTTETGAITYLDKDFIKMNRTKFPKKEVLL